MFLEVEEEDWMIGGPSAFFVIKEAWVIMWQKGIVTEEEVDYWRSSTGVMPGGCSICVY